MKCSNCDNESLFEYQITFNNSIFYCGKHLPKFLDARKRAGLLKKTDSFTTASKEALDILSKIEEPVVEEKVVEEPKEEVVAPKPKKKAAKKKAE